MRKSLLFLMLVMLFCCKVEVYAQNQNPTREEVEARANQGDFEAMYALGRAHFRGIAGFTKDEDNGKYGYIDKSGAVVIDCKWDKAGDFHEGMAPVKKDDKYGFINIDGELVVPCKWKGFHSFFHYGLAVVYGFDENEYYIDMTGKVIKQKQ